MPEVSLNGYRLHYETYGSGPPLLLIAGTGSPHTSWLDQIPVYAEDFSCIAYDARGIGLSTTDGQPLTIKDLALDALALLDHLDIDRCDIVGTSLGAATALEMCLAHPDRVSRLILHAAWDRTSSYPHLVRQFQLRIDLIQRGELELYEELSLLWLFGADYFNSVLAHRGGKARPIKTQAEWDSIVRLHQANLGHDTRGRLDRIAVPTLVTLGQDDFLVRPSYSKELAASISGAELVIWPEVGHLARIEQPDTFTATTLSFLKR
jgi:pimeloyl-ACP methyl ester carboxylesterase